MALNTDDITINTLIGAGSSVSGDVKAAGFIRVDGDINGSIETTGRIIIGEKARIKGSVNALSAIIGGIVEGDITAPDSVHLFSSAAVIGDIITHKLNLEEGVIFHGNCISVTDPAAFAQAKEQWVNLKIIRTKTFKPALDIVK